MSATFGNSLLNFGRLGQISRTLELHRSETQEHWSDERAEIEMLAEYAPGIHTKHAD